MTREELLTTAPDLTDEQLKAILDAHNSEVLAEKEKNKTAKLKNKEDDEKMKSLENEKAELAKKLEEAENSNLTELEKVTKNFEAAQAEIAELKKAQLVTNMRSDAMAKFKISAEQAKEIISETGDFNMEKLGSIISEKESAAALAKEQEIARMSSNPNGQNGGGGEDTFAKDLAVASAKSSNKANQDIINSYKR